MTTIVLLLVSNTFMTFAWYGHLKFKEVAWNYIVSFVLIIGAVYFAFKEWQ